MDSWLVRQRATIFILICVGAVAAVMYGIGVGNATVGSAFYTLILIVLASAPVLWLTQMNDRNVLLAAFMGTYFLLFGALGLRDLLLGSDTDLAFQGDNSFITAAQFAVILSAALIIAGYRLGVSWVPVPDPARIRRTEFSSTVVLLMGGFCWIFGSASLAYYAIVVTPVNSTQATTAGFASIGSFGVFAVMLGYLLQPLGVLMLAFGYARYRTPFWLGIVIAMVVLQVVLGFATDTKGTALLGVLLVAITQTLWDNKMSKGWVLGVFVFAIIIFPVMQAARIERNERGLDRARAFEQFSQVLTRAWESREKDNEGKSGQRAQSFIERSSEEAALEPIFERVGVDTPFLNGYSLIAVPYAFVPRLLMPEKEDVPIGQLYGKVFGHADLDSFTYISFSEVGEFYWNFGWPGVVLGALFTGLLLGVVGAKSSLQESHSLTRLLVLLITIKTVCFGFGGSAALVYVVWMRAVAAIGLMHLMFARPSAEGAAGESPAEQLPAATADGRTALQGPLFPNLMR